MSIIFRLLLLTHVVSRETFLLAQFMQGLQQVVEVVHTVVLDLDATLLFSVGDAAGAADTG